MEESNAKSADIIIFIRAEKGTDSPLQLGSNGSMSVGNEVAVTYYNAHITDRKGNSLYTDNVQKNLCSIWSHLRNEVATDRKKLAKWSRKHSNK